MLRSRVRIFPLLTPLLVAALLLAPVKPARANPVVGVVAGVAVVYAVLGTAGNRVYDSEHSHIDFSLAQIDDEMSRIESDCDSAQHARSRGNLYDRLDQLRAQLKTDPQNSAFLGRLDALRKLPHGEEAYYVALMEKTYDYVGYPFAGNRYYVKRASVLDANPCRLPTVASLTADSTAPPSGPSVTALMP